MRRAYLVSLWLLFILAGCATWTTQPQEIVDGRMLEALLQDFKATAAAYDATYRAKQMPEEDYQVWREYVRRFQQDIPAAHKAWQKAAMAGEPLDKAHSAKVRALKRELDLMRKLTPP